MFFFSIRILWIGERKEKTEFAKIIVSHAMCCNIEKWRKHQPKRDKMQRKIFHKAEVEFHRMNIIVIGFRIEMG